MEKNEDQKFVDDVAYMEAIIVAHIDRLIKEDEDCDYHLDVNKNNLTEFFTALSNAVGHKLIKIGMAQNILEANQICNTLTVQYLLKRKAKVEK